jgi:methylglutaconyl-CoA hydratase
LTDSSEEPTTKILSARDGSRLTLTISRPEHRNPLGTTTAGELAAALKEADADHEVRVIVLTGAGQAFSSGGDLREFVATASQTADAHWSSGAVWADLFHTLMGLSKPTVCQVRGPAMAGGCGLVAACDFAIAADDATFAVPEAKVGLFPLFIMPALLRAVGRRQALSLALTARTIKADEAVKIGLLTTAVPGDQLDDEVNKLVAQLASVGPLTMAMGKRAFQQLAEMELNVAIEAARDLRVPFMSSPELKAGIEAFLKRKAAK